MAITTDISRLPSALCGWCSPGAIRIIRTAARQNSAHVDKSFLTATAIANVLVASGIGQAMMTGLISQTADDQ